MTSSRQIEAVVFDVGGTLVDPWPSVGAVYADVAKAWGLGRVDVPRLDHQFAAAWGEREGFDYSLSAWRLVVERSFAGQATMEEVAAFFPALYERFSHAESWKVYGDVVPTLAALRAAGFRLAILSNWDERLQPLLGRLGLSRYFDVVVASWEVGYTKPNVRVFREVERRLGCGGERLMMVGDSVSEDWEGAGRAGWNRVLLRRGGGSSDGASADLREVAAKLGAG